MHPIPFVRIWLRIRLLRTFRRRTSTLHIQNAKQARHVHGNALRFHRVRISSLQPQGYARRVRRAWPVPTKHANAFAFIALSLEIALVYGVCVVLSSLSFARTK